MSQVKKKRNKKYNPDKKMDAQRKELLDDITKVKRCVEGIGQVAGVCKNSLKKIDDRYNCFQFQLMIQDFESILMHIEDLQNVGPKPVQKEIPLEESEITEEQELEDNAALLSLHDQESIEDMNSGMSNHK
jgi:hypothetical protein